MGQRESTGVGSHLLSLPEVSEILGVSLSTLRRLIRKREIAAYRVGGQIRVDPRHLDTYLAQARIGQQPGAREDTVRGRGGRSVMSDDLARLVDRSHRRSHEE